MSTGQALNTVKGFYIAEREGNMPKSTTKIKFYLGKTECNIDGYFCSSVFK
jgi:hypothetical protein